MYLDILTLVHLVRLKQFDHVNTNKYPRKQSHWWTGWSNSLEMSIVGYWIVWMALSISIIRGYGNWKGRWRNV